VAILNTANMSDILHCRNARNNEQH